MSIADDQRREAAAKFNRLSATYDRLQFLQICARRLTELAPLAAGARVLDVVTGTGEAALAAGRITGPTGKVVGVDIAAEMLALARQKAARAGLSHVEFREADVEQLDLPDESFDVVLCAASLFFMQDMSRTLKEFRRVLAPGGCAGFSGFGPSFLQPLRSLWEARLKSYGLTASWLPTHRLADPAACKQLLEQADFVQTEVRREQLGYFLKSAGERWDEIEAGLEGEPLLQLSPEQRDRIKAEHLEELSAAATPEGIWVDVPAIFSFGRRASWLI